MREEILEERVVCSRNRSNPRAVKRKMSKFPILPRVKKRLPNTDIKKAIRIVK